MAQAIRLDPLNVGDTHRLRFTVTKDGTVWDLSAGGVVLKVLKPDGTRTTWTMTPESAATGVFHYDTLTTDVDQAGNWSLGLTADDGVGTVKTYAGDISLEVSDRPWYG